MKSIAEEFEDEDILRIAASGYPDDNPKTALGEAKNKLSDTPTIGIRELGRVHTMGTEQQRLCRRGRGGRAVSKGVVISLYDFTGEACRPWAEAGYDCFCFDIQHDGTKSEMFEGGGAIYYRHADLHDPKTYQNLFFAVDTLDVPVAFGMAFPVCTDLAVSGAAWFAKKAEADPDFQTKAAHHAIVCAEFFGLLGVPFFVENPVSVLATKWRKPDHAFHPYEYGGYISDAEAEHPRWPEYIAPHDAYKKKTCLWTGGGFKMPDTIPVQPEHYHGNGYSTAMMKLGGKSQRTKDIRSATPRGFAKAVYAANAKGENQ